MKLICAPMATLSHPAFRILIEKFGGCDEYYTEMINAPSLLNGGQFEKYYIDPAPVPNKIVWQLTGKTSDSIIKVSSILANTECIGIDLNMGCCAPDIVNSGAGIAWMLKPIKETQELVSGVKKVLDDYENESKIHKRLSVKIRLGDDDFTDESFFSFCQMLKDCGVEQITVHPRTKKEKYREKPRWHYANELALRLKDVSVIVNGDIKDVNSFKNVTSICPNCSGVMVGRAAVQKPWIFQELNCADNPDELKKLSVDFLELALDFIDALEIYQPPEFWKTRMQRFFSYFCMNLSFSHFAKTQLLNSVDLNDARKRVKEYFEKVPSDRVKKFN